MSNKLLLSILLILYSPKIFSQIYQDIFKSCSQVKSLDTVSLVKRTCKIVVISFVDRVKVIPKNKIDIEIYKHTGKIKPTYVRIWAWKADSLLVSLDSSVVQERKALTGKEMNSFLNLFYKRITPKDGTLPEQAICYEPHHGIIFYDESDTPFAYFEMCFSCRQVYASKGFYFGEFCYERLKSVNAYFKEWGWKYMLGNP
ncbi:hypothetical protein [Xanthocytophaga flava]|uniref:hypothetical protein n=1 Tax=Xanthocytophaga flava TaxID=3048013 RepID=UPI0028D155E0|nr:hypothetical protein [Xanthocytophaga flavus]MDJ1467904.1 hypothetical protein [Xanthocytophaga flavus]